MNIFHIEMRTKTKYECNDEHILKKKKKKN